jgi:hypothetical protein
MDEAGWDTAGDLVVPENLSLVLLPRYRRETIGSRTAFSRTGEIIDTCCDAWNWLLDQPDGVGRTTGFFWE